MKVYVAGPLFTPAERGVLVSLADVVRESGHEPLLPFTPGAEFPEPVEDRSELYRRCVDALRAADAVIAVLDGPDADSGTSYEVGFAVSRGVPVLGVRTDYRTLGPEGPVNLMLEQGALRLARHPGGGDALTDDVRAFLKDPATERREPRLVRDKTPSAYRTEGRAGRFRRVEGYEYLQYLRRKIVEEAEAVLAADEELDEKERVMELLTAVETLIAYRAYSKDSLRRIKEKRQEAHGGYNLGYVLVPGATDAPESPE